MVEFYRHKHRYVYEFSELLRVFIKPIHTLRCVVTKTCNRYHILYCAIPWAHKTVKFHNQTNSCHSEAFPSSDFFCIIPTYLGTGDI